MKALIVHSHPEPKSFNSALKNVAVETLQQGGCEVVVSDLYSMGFDPVSDRRNFTTVCLEDYFKQQSEEVFAQEHGGFAQSVRTEQEKILAADFVLFQFPLWWFGLPAILKGWVDRVFAMGVMYGGGRWYDKGVCAGKRAMLSLTTGGPASMYSEDGLNGYMETILYPINHGILRFTGFEVLPPFVAYSAGRVSDEIRKAYLEEFRGRVANWQLTEPIRYPALSEFDPVTFERRRS